MHAYGSTKRQHDTGKLTSHNTGHRECGDLNRGRAFTPGETRAARKRARQRGRKEAQEMA